ncbi:MAG: TrpR-like protein YerC/YecD [Clostridia bacterium]|nr:TrpR-like protein YerC/YecD [Clostridia bacterium]
MEEYQSRLKDENMDALFEAILSLRTQEECYRFFEDLCTIPELKSISQRWHVARELDKGVTYQDISAETKASSATISRVNRCLAYGTGGYTMMLKRVGKEE